MVLSDKSNIAALPASVVDHCNALEDYIFSGNLIKCKYCRYEYTYNSQRSVFSLKQHSNTKLHKRCRDLMPIILRQVFYVAKNSN